MYLSSCLLVILTKKVIYLDLVITFSPISCRGLQYSPLGNSNHVLVSIDISFELSIKDGPLIHKSSFSFQHTGLNSFRDVLRDTHWIDIFKRHIENRATGISYCVQASFYAFVPCQKYHAISFGSHQSLQSL